MGGIYIDIESKDLQRKVMFLQVVRNGAPRAVAQAMNRAADGMKADAMKEITATYAVKGSQAKVRSLIAVQKASETHLSAGIRSRGRPLRSFYYKHKANTSPGRRGGKSAFLQVKKAGGGGRLDGANGNSKAFMATMPNGMRGIFRRNAKGKLIQVWSPGVVQMLDNEGVKAVVERNALKRFNANLDQRIRHLVGKGVQL